MPSSQSKSMGVFHALGSYADRIKEPGSTSGSSANGKADNALGGSSPPSGASSASRSTSPAAAATATPTAAVTPKSPQPTAVPPANPTIASVADSADDGWETVSTSRNRSRSEKQDEKRGSNSRNWRERDEKPESKKESDDTSTERRGRKDKSSHKGQPSASVRQSVSTSNGAKSAWGSRQPATMAESAAETPSSPTAPSGEADKTAAAATATEGATSEEPKPRARSADTEGSWRARPKAAPEPSPAPPVVKKVAPPPSVNAWDVRKKASTKAAAVHETPVLPVATPAASSAAEAPASEPNPDAKAGGGKKKKKHSGEHHHHHHHHHHGDSTHWPDVNQAAEAAKSAEEEKRKNDKKDGGSASETVPTPTTAGSAAGGKKQKWTAIPAAELQEAADKVAITARRQGGSSKAKARAGKESEAEGKRGKKGAHEAKKAPRLQRAGSQGSLPPFPEAQRSLHPNGGPRFGSGAAAATGAELKDEPFNGFATGTLSAPLSRQGSQHSKRGSPSHSSVPLSPSGAGELDGGRTMGQVNGTGVGRPARGRERDGRGGYGGGRGGRGGYRSASNVSARGAHDLSPLAGTTELANIYQRGYGMGYNVYPVATGGFVLAPPGYDAAQYAAVMQAYSSNRPPPPQPVTQVSNIDGLRYYVLGQVEYYFSMQNLVMDFFLRQQMDSQGWIEISMIASFNRIKSLTPDVAIVKEVMEMSQLLEVKEDMVRLAGDEAVRWVLPDARPCKFNGGSPDGRNLSPKKLAGEGVELSHSLPGGVDPSTVSALGFEDILQAPVLLKFDVENALMRNVRDGSANVSTSSTASVLASEEGKTMTPETSIAGDSKSEFDAEDIKIE